MTTDCQNVLREKTSQKPYQKHRHKTRCKTFKAAAIAAAVSLCCLASQASYAQSVSISVDKLQTNAVPKWRWNASGEATDCQIQVRDGTSWKVLFDEVLGQTSEFSYRDGFKHNTSYQARVRCSADAGLTWGNWTGYTTAVTVDTVAPRIELDTFRKEFSTYDPFQSLFTVSFETLDDLVGVDRVHIQIAKDIAFTDLVHDSVVNSRNDTSISVLTDFPDGVYYARVAAIDKAGNHSVFSIVKEVNSSNVYEEIVVISRPFTNQAPVWDWVKIDGFDSYEIEIQDDNGQVLHSEVVGTNNQFTYTAGAEHEKKFKARVRGSDDGGMSWKEWSPLSDVVTVDKEAPILELDAFVRQFEEKRPMRKRRAAPIDTNQDVTVTPELAKYWHIQLSSYDYLSRIKTTRIQIASDAEFNHLVSDEEIGYDLYEYDFVPDETMIGNNYFVRIKVIDEAGNETEMTRKLDTASPNYYLSNYQDQYANSAPTWSWPLIDGANLYKVRIDKDAETIFDDVIGNTDHYTYGGTVKEGELYDINIEYSLDNGQTWNLFAGYRTNIDLQMPEVSLESFTYEGNGQYSLQLGMYEDPWTLASAYLQLSHDPEFKQLAHEQVFKGYELPYLWVNLNSFQDDLYARVKLVDKAGNESDYTPARSLNSSDRTDIDWVSIQQYNHEGIKLQWVKPDSMNAFEVEVQNENGDVLHTQQLSDINQYLYKPQNVIHGQKFQLRVRGSSDHGLTWQEWSNIETVTVDTITPSVQLDYFYRDSEEGGTIGYKLKDDSYYSDLKIQIAVDPEFNQIIHSEIRSESTSNEQKTLWLSGDFLEKECFIRLQAIDRAGNASGFTPVMAMTEELDLQNFAAAAGNINTYPLWWWVQNEKVHNHEFEILDQNGQFVEQDSTTQNIYFNLNRPVEHGERFIARVRGQSIFNGAWGTWTDYSAPIMVDLEAPSAQLSSFIHTSATQVEFKYVLADDLSPLGYVKIEVATEPEFNNVVFNETISATKNPTSYKTTLTQSGDLYARIAVFDGAGNLSEYSQIFKVDTVMTSIPVIYSGSVYTKNAPSWWWSAAYNINAYQIEIQNSAGEVVRTEALEKTTRYVYEAGLVHGHEYRARVRGSIDKGETWGEWSNLSGLQTVDTLPSELNILSFMHIDATTAELRYSVNDTLSSMDSITIQVSEDADFETILTTHDLWPGEMYRTYTLKNLPENKVLYARMMGVDRAGNASEFTSGVQVDTAIAEKPQLTAQRYVNQIPKWSWEKPYLATDYEIEIKDKEGAIVFNQNIGNVDYFAYTEGFIHGQEFTAKVRVSLDNGNSWSEWSDEQSVLVDTIKPQPEFKSIEHRTDGLTWVAFSMLEETTSVQVQLQIATDETFTHMLYNKTSSIHNPNGMNGLGIRDLPKDVMLYARLKAFDAAGNESGFTPVMTTELAAPNLSGPVTGSIFYTPDVEVRGKTFANAEVQIYVNEQAVGSLIAADARGQFSTIIALSSEGENSITATVQNNAGVSKPSDTKKVEYQIPVPDASSMTPADGATVAASTLLTVSASDVLGIAKVEFYDGDTLLATVTEAPYQYPWEVQFEDNGTHTLKTVVTNTSGKSVTLEQTVEVDVAPKEIPVPPTSYTGKVESVSPAISYGEEPIHISGIAVDRSTSAPIGNRPLKLVLDTKGFKRTINIVANENGAFAYNFMPQTGDKGTYQVSVVHPDEEMSTSQGSFNINRVSFNVGGYKLSAARNHPTQFAVKATSTGDVKGLRWIALAEDQPAESLPQGISISESSGIDIAEGKSASINITLTADDTAATTGTIYLRAVSDDAVNQIRGWLRVDYQLVQAAPYLFIEKNSIQTGVKQGESSNETITLTNKGLSAAKNVRVELEDEHGKTPPAWMFLANTGAIGVVNVGDEVSVQITAQPDASIADGIYRFKLHVTADNGSTADAYITVAVTQSGIGGVRFNVADIYTATLGEDELPILGVKGATIKLQNEAVLSEQYEVKTDNDGTALLEELPPGIYLYRVSASNHMDVSGRVRIRPGVVVDQDIFLDYQLINIEFGVTETTIQDIYDIVLEATFQTQVPAPVVLVEPLSINIGGMQVGEEKTGQLTITNYGLIEAEEVNFTPPQSDSAFKYEFFGEIPESLPPKSRVVIPYRVTALGGSSPQSKEVENEPKFRMMPMAAASRAAQCSGYSKGFSVKFAYKCANGAKRNGNSGGSYNSLSGKNCSSNNVISWGGGGISGDGAWMSGGWGSTPAPMSMAKECTPKCPAGKCDKGSGSAKR